MLRLNVTADLPKDVLGLRPAGQAKICFTVFLFTAFPLFIVATGCTATKKFD
jgi:hypothetical protein